MARTPVPSSAWLIARRGESDTARLRMSSQQVRPVGKMINGHRGQMVVFHERLKGAILPTVQSQARHNNATQIVISSLDTDPR
jgi:hypothetical protein